VFGVNSRGTEHAPVYFGAVNLQKLGSFLKSYLFLRLLLNAIFLYVWIAGTVANFRLSTVSGNARNQLEMHAVVYNALLLATLYLNTLIFIPRLLLQKKYLGYGCGLLLSVLLHTVILLFYREYIVDHIPGVSVHDFSYYSAFVRQSREHTLQFFWFLFYNTSAFTVIQFSLIFLGQHFFIAIRQNEIIRQQQTEMELSVLKSQINPHFLFNVLNSIYSLSLKKSDDTPEVVMRLSEILRYMLYEAKHELVPVQREIQTVLDYADIERMRLSDDQTLNLRISDDRKLPFRIAPLLLIPFVENAIKHGTNTVAEAAFVEIDIRVLEETLYFSCSNNFKPQPRPRDSGLGLENIRKRLQLLYPGKHVLHIHHQENVFDVSLSIQLSL
jgi:two-component system LytT family sensor kinase